MKRFFPSLLSKNGTRSDVVSGYFHTSSRLYPDNLVQPYRFILLCLLLIGCQPVSAQAARAHLTIKGPFTSLAEANNQCIKCHEQQAEDLRKSIHWTWQRKRTINGAIVLSSKDNDLSRFAIAPGNNPQACHRCHISSLPGSSLANDKSLNFINCLVCHDTTGLYTPGVQFSRLVSIARQAGRPSVRNCRTCHEQQCGLTPAGKKNIGAGDVHLQCYGFTCQQCHSSGGHHVMSRTMAVNPEQPQASGCASCHGQKPHTLARLNRHALLIACQSCHIPLYGDNQPRVISWNWYLGNSEYQLIGDDRAPLADVGFLLGAKIRPVYLWDDGSDTLYTRGDRAKPGKTTLLQGPGPRSPTSKIMPFSIEYGTQLQDRKFHYLLSPLLSGMQAPFWKNGTLAAAVAAGMQAIRLPYSGESATVTTIALRRINHGVKSADQALDCMDCHGSSALFNWQKLGYRHDPWADGRENRQTPPLTRTPPRISLPPVEESVLPVTPEMETMPSR